MDVVDGLHNHHVVDAWVKTHLRGGLTDDEYMSSDQMNKAEYV
jgi:hypothetical protein